MRYRLISAISVGLGAVILLTIFSSYRVAESARHTAGPTPYCIQISSDRDYKPARSWSDISILNMWASRVSGIFMQHHAILVVINKGQPELFHWSYLNQKFIAGARNDKVEGYGPAITCIPERNFVSNLALIFSASDEDYIRFSSNEVYHIPKAYRAKWSGGSGRYLSIAANAPQFSPMTVWEDLSSNRRIDSLFVDWNEKWLLEAMKPDGREAEMPQTNEFGMQKTTTIFYGTNKKRYDSQIYRLYGDGQLNGLNTTYIRCGPPSTTDPRSCQHRFLNKGRHFGFRHTPAEIPSWQDMQKRLLDLFASFEVQNNNFTKLNH